MNGPVLSLDVENQYTRRELHTCDHKLGVPSEEPIEEVVQLGLGSCYPRALASNECSHDH